MSFLSGKKKILLSTVLFAFVSFIIWNLNLFGVKAAALVYYKEIRFQGRVEATDTSETENAVPQSMAGNGNTIYLLKTRKTKSTVEDRSYIVKKIVTCKRLICYL